MFSFTALLDVYKNIDILIFSEFAFFNLIFSCQCTIYYYSFSFIVVAPSKNKTRIHGGPLTLPSESPVHNSNMIVQTSTAPASPQVTLIEADTSTVIPKLEVQHGK